MSSVNGDGYLATGFSLCEIVTLMSVWQRAISRETLPDSSLLLAHRLRRRPSIKPTLGQRLVFAGMPR